MVPPDASSLLDVGCNVGALLSDWHRRRPELRLAGVEVNAEALASAKRDLSFADLQCAGAEALPFADGSFECVTCTEVVEHVPPELRAAAFREIHRVLRPGGRLVLTTPHAGLFAFADSNNMRFRFGAVYRMVIRNGLRDRPYEGRGRAVEWHQHFTLEELLQLAGDGWNVVAVQRGGLFLYPLMDWLSWPFYRMGRSDHWLRRLFQRIAGWDYSVDFGRASYGIMIVLDKQTD